MYRSLTARPRWDSRLVLPKLVFPNKYAAYTVSINFPKQHFFLIDKFDINSVIEVQHVLYKVLLGTSRKWFRTTTKETFKCGLKIQKHIINFYFYFFLYT